ncbi:hypothetical protein CAOG_06070 [Capsaspora owczarzaki ATCC 30864]|uniref:Signal peptidase complex subunit 2 n=1 Tax=Capsaspora owczarzaki (strain ATCC 30864) TaxID=595528 RepID=A0A0D2UKR6_CAPO3|nr:hypothetical protein CAOG_06070 [Capsaspora owczarzaki ATCC 30864]KJE95641.1 hypothetical protein CAOG_006070 [Capsaspora owczarzaki ATCC 30864]|eukprot:XP_004345660.1 hypothetical protein CAOG_06070 [Capsaspora owczarzaki ATCC 30864]
MAKSVKSRPASSAAAAAAAATSHTSPANAQQQQQQQQQDPQVAGAAEQTAPEESYPAVDLYDSVAVKSTMDDSLRGLLTLEAGFIESHRRMDIKIGMSAAAIALTGFALAWGYFVPFPESSLVVGTCVVLYFALMLVITAYTFFAEGVTVFEGLRQNVSATARPGSAKAQESVVVDSEFNKLKHEYTLKITLQRYGKAPVTESLSKPVGSYFHSDGYFAETAFDSDARKLLKQVESKLA